MRRRSASVLVALVALVVVNAGFSMSAHADKPDVPGEQELMHRPVCGPAPAGFARCHAQIVVHPDKRPTTTTSTSSSTSTSTSSSTSTTAPAAPLHPGFGPSDLQAAYNLPSSTAGGGRTVAVVDAYDAPKAEADLAVYRSSYGLPSCTTANGCFRKVNQRGGTTPPRADGAWAQEISLDLDIVSASCPNCRVLLVEADTASFTNLGIAVNVAAQLGASAISNSYGASESLFGSTPDDSPYNHPGVAITASTGDNGYGVQFPASSGYVTAVGGTSLSRVPGASRGWSETAWSGAGSGCSVFFPKPSWQADPGCSRRTVADVSAVADPATGVAVFDSYAYQGQSGWLVFGGTSVASPLVASVYALGVTGSAPSPSAAYSHTSSLYDVVAGTNGACTTTYLCNSVVGYDGPTGLGTPNGTSAFAIS